MNRNELTIVLRAKDLASRTLRTLGSGVTKFAGGAVGAFNSIRRSVFSLQGLIAGALGGSFVSLFAEFDQSIRAVGTLTNATEADLDRFGGVVKRIAAESGQDLSALSKAAFDAISAGVDPDALEPFLRTSSRLAVAGVAEVDAATEGLVRTLSGYRLSLSDADRVSNIFFASQLKGITTIQELATNIGTVAAQAKNSGLSLEQLFSSIGVLSKSVSTPQAITQAITQLQSLLTFLSRIPEEVIPLRDELRKLGFDLSLENLTRDPVAFFRRLNEVTGGSAEAFNKLFRETNAALAAQNLAAGGAADLESTLKAVTAAAGSTDRAFDLVANGLQNRLSRAFNEVRSGLLGIAREINPELNDLADVVALFGRKLQENGQIIAAFVRLGVSLIGELFTFIGTALDRYSRDNTLVWADAGKAVRLFFDSSLIIVGTGLKTLLILARRAAVGIALEIGNAFKGFSLQDLLTQGDAFRSQRGALGLVTALENEVDGARKEQARLQDIIQRLKSDARDFAVGVDEATRLRVGLAQRVAGGAVIPGGTFDAGRATPEQRQAFIAVLDEQIRNLRQEAERKGKELDQALEQAGFLSPEKFGARLNSELAAGVQEAGKQVDSLFAGFNSLFKNFLRGIGQENVLSNLDVIFERFRSDLAKANQVALSPANQAGAIEAAKATGVEVGKAAAQGAQEGAAGGLRLPEGFFNLNQVDVEATRDRIRELRRELEVIGVPAGLQRDTARIEADFQREADEFRKLQEKNRITAELANEAIVTAERIKSLAIDELRRQESASFDQRAREIQDAIAVLNLVDPVDRQVESLKQAYQRDVDSFRFAQEQKVIDADRANALIADRGRLLELEIQEIRSQGFQGFQQSLTEFEQAQRSVGPSLSAGFADLFGSIISGAQSAQQAIANFVQQSLSQLSSLFLNAAFRSFGAELFPSLFPIPNANGNVLRGGFRAFANGSPRITEPTLGLVGEGRFNEAIVPLPDGRRIPVDLRGMAPPQESNSISVTFNVQAVDGESVSRLLIGQSTTIESIIERAISKRPSFRGSLRSANLGPGGR